MGRVLVLVIACVAGALVAWLFVPTIQRVPVNKDMPVFTYDPDPAPREDTTVPPKGVMSEEKRRLRAEQLVGDQLKYISRDEVHSVDWFTAQGVQVIERAMDECYLVTEPDLYMQHLAALGTDESEEDWNGEEAGGSDMMKQFMSKQPNVKQGLNCVNVHRAYAALRQIEIDF